MIRDFSNSVKRGGTGFLTIAQETGRRIGRGLFGSRDCLLCLDNAGMRALCPPCERLLARPGPACSRCARRLPEGGACGRCLPARSPLDGIAAAFDYGFPVDRLVHRFKFGGDLATGSVLAVALAKAVAGRRPPDLLVPSPASRARLRERGFNPAAELARRLSRELRLDWDPGILLKVRHTPPQTGLSRAQRRRNLRDAFRCGEVTGRRIAVVDDVTTTGATLEALARALRAAGAAGVEGWVVARTPPPGRAP